MGGRVQRAGLFVAILAGWAVYVGSAFRVYFAGFSSQLIGNHGDVLLQHLHLAWQWRALSAGRFSEWLVLPTLYPWSSGYAFGEPLLGISLPLLPFYLASGSSAFAFNLAVVLSFVLLGVAVGGWARDMFHSPGAGAMAAVLVVFTPWRLHYLTNLNNLTAFYAVFGMWLLYRWLRRPQLGVLLAAALLFHVQLVTSQVGLAAIYLSCIWLGVFWLGSGLRVDARRVGQGALALALFLVLSVPWLDFFAEGFMAGSGIVRLDEMIRYSAPFTEMMRLVGVLSLLGLLAFVGALSLGYGAVRGDVERVTWVSLTGLAVGAVSLLVLGRGPAMGTETELVRLPSFYVLHWLPFFDSVRAPIRWISFTPIVLALFAAASWARLEEALRRMGGKELGAPRAAQLLSILLPLAVGLWIWPSLPEAMVSPASERPGASAIGAALARLPESAVILPLPMNLDPSGAAVDEWVLLHGRSQISGFASVVPQAYRYARRSLGQWPHFGLTAARSLGATHLVIPVEVSDRESAVITRAGYTRIERVAGYEILRMPAEVAKTPGAPVVEVPKWAAAGRWLTLGVTRDEPGFRPVSYASFEAHWNRRDESEKRSTVEAFAFIPGIGGAESPVRIHVPAPPHTGRYTLSIACGDLCGGDVRAEVEVRSLATTLDTEVTGVAIELQPELPSLSRVRGGEPFIAVVRLSSTAEAPLLLASSRCDFPERCGEVVVEYRMRRRDGMSMRAEMPGGLALRSDLVPGASRKESWFLTAPPYPGRYSVFARLRSRGLLATSDWTQLHSDLLVE